MSLLRMKPHRVLREMLFKPKDPTLNHHQIELVTESLAEIVPKSIQDNQLVPYKVG